MFVLGFIGLLPDWASITMGTGLSGGCDVGIDFRGLEEGCRSGVGGLGEIRYRGAITTALRMPFVLLPFAVDFVELQQAPLLLLQHVLMQVMIGLIGGASLGATLGYLEHRKLVAEREPRVR